MSGLERQNLIDIGKKFYDKNFLAAADGNFSCRLSDDQILITPSGLSKSQLRAEDMVVMNLKGEVLEGKAPSSEKSLHLSVYQQAPQARVVLHAHPPKAVSCSLVFKEKLPSQYLSEVILATGDIPILEYARPGTEAMAQGLVSFLPRKKVFILSHHGALSWGENFQEAVFGMERLEHACQILIDAHQLGKPKALDEEEIKWLYEKRKEIGNKTL